LKIAVVVFYLVVKPRHCPHPSDAKAGTFRLGRAVEEVVDANLGGQPSRLKTLFT
jgi:hypothetical protein